MSAVVLLSGGLDSTVLLYDAIRAEDRVEALTFFYGQTHRREIDAAVRIAALARIPHRVITLPSDCFAGSSLTTGEGLVVPNRNMVFVSLAVAYAAGHGFDKVLIGATRDDHDTWPDCRLGFFDRLDAAVQYANPVRLLAPYVEKSKRAVADRGRYLGVDLDETWSCYEGGDEPCGSCAACLARDRALS